MVALCIRYYRTGTPLTDLLQELILKGQAATEIEQTAVTPSCGSSSADFSRLMTSQLPLYAALPRLQQPWRLWYMMIAQPDGRTRAVAPRYAASLSAAGLGTPSTQRSYN
jgi:hypothetical protein